MNWISSSVIIAAITWIGLWYTPDQYGQHLLKQGDFVGAAEAFRDPMRQGCAWFRAGEFEKAEQAFARIATPAAEFNRGTSLIMLGKYDAAVERFDRALQLKPDYEDARINRDIAVARAKRTERKGGDMGDQKLGADEIVYDKDKKSGGAKTEDEGAPMSNADMQAMWLRRVQTKPADFLRAKFAFQLASGDTAGENSASGDTSREASGQQQGEVPDGSQ